MAALKSSKRSGTAENCSRETGCQAFVFGWMRSASRTKMGAFSSLAARPLVVFECSRQMDPGRFAVWKERKEVKEMNTLVIVLIAAVCLLGAYTFYGRWLANKWGIDPKAKTPQSSTRTAATTSPPTAGPFLPISSAPSQVPALSPVPSRLPHSAGCPFCCGS